MQTDELVLTVSDFVAVLNQTLEYAYPSIVVTGELANFRVSKGRWVYFDLKDEHASVKCFATIYQLPGPLEDGMLLNVRATPRLHQLYGFSLNATNIQPAGEGTIRRASELLRAKLTAEGLFDDSRKRVIPYPPARIGLIASGESAAYIDFMKILQARWSGVEIVHADVQVQGEVAPAQIVAAIEQLNGLATPPDVLVITRGGGSAEDLQAFSTEQVTRAVAASRVPTLVAIGHEVDVSLAELAADQRASTPSNAAELLVPDRQYILRTLKETRQSLARAVSDRRAISSSSAAH
jgi:exodeoxyribonuclease VII large subunit